MYFSHFHASRPKQIVLILTIGIGIGVLIPNVMQQLPVTVPAERLEYINVLTQDVPETSLSEKFTVHVKDDILSIVQGDPQAGQVILSGIHIDHWPEDMKSKMTQFEFHSFDEVQSFIDSMTEEFWIE